MQHSAERVAERRLELGELACAEPLRFRRFRAPKTTNARLVQRDLNDSIAVERDVEARAFAEPLQIGGYRSRATVAKSLAWPSSRSIDGASRPAAASEAAPTRGSPTMRTRKPRCAAAALQARPMSPHPMTRTSAAEADESIDTRTT